MSEPDVTVLVTDDIISQVLDKCRESLPLYNGSIERGLDFANALLYHLEDALENWFGNIGRCQCMSTLQIADLHRGYCTNCSKTITVRVSGKAIDL